MRTTTILLFVLIIIFGCSSGQSDKTLQEPGQNIQNGDIIFQTSQSGQSKAIQRGTNSKYSHMGIIYKTEGQYFVFEAVQPVQLTSLQDWIKKGKTENMSLKD